MEEALNSRIARKQYSQRMGEVMIEDEVAEVYWIAVLAY